MEMNKKMLGVIGGLGPMATAVFLERIVRYTDAQTDQEHIDIAIRHCPSIPDRTAFLLGRSSLDPLPPMLKQARILADTGAQCIAIPCITAHSFHDQIERGCALPVIDTVTLTAETLRKKGVQRAAIWATEGTVRVGLFQKAFARAGLEAVLPDEQTQDMITKCIYQDIKTGRAPDIQALLSTKQGMLQQGAQAVVLGCTELSVAAAQGALGPGVIDALDVLACAAIEQCGAKVRPQYTDLFEIIDL